MTTPQAAEQWPVPTQFIAQIGDDTMVRTWVETASLEVSELARRWDLSPDGPSSCGYMSCIWPVRTPDGHRAVLKAGPRLNAARREATALQAWAAIGADVVDLLATDEATGAMLLRRLDARRDLMTEPDADRATSIIAELLAGAARPAPLSIPPVSGHWTRSRPPSASTRNTTTPA